MTLDALTDLLPLLAALSVASERLVEIIKNLVPPLNWTLTESQEPFRRAVLQLLAGGAGILIVSMIYPALAEIEVLEALSGGAKWRGVLLLGLLSSGGSGFWNSLLTFVLRAKDAKRNEAVGRPTPRPLFRASSSRSH